MLAKWLQILYLNTSKWQFVENRQFITSSDNKFYLQAGLFKFYWPEVKSSGIPSISFIKGQSPSFTMTPNIIWWDFPALQQLAEKTFKKMKRIRLFFEDFNLKVRWLHTILVVWIGRWYCHFITNLIFPRISISFFLDCLSSFNLFWPGQSLCFTGVQETLCLVSERKWLLEDNLDTVAPNYHPKV